MEIKKIVLYNPAISSINLGDHIISAACKEHLKPIIANDMSIEISTHLPVSNLYLGLIEDVRYSFVLGSNLLMPKLDARFRQWDIKMWNVDKMKPIILMGVGWHQYSTKTSTYTKNLYKKILSSEYIHSVRDEYTKNKLNEIGITNVLNTGCPTLWNLTKEHCKKIPTHKADKVIFTLTDYDMNVEKDTQLIDILNRNYKEVYFWIQGSDDYKYLKTLKNTENVKIVPPSVEAYNDFIKNNEVDFIGTRLHGGIRALQYGKRTVIIAIDNRARELKKDSNIPTIDRENLDQLESMINSELITDIKLPEENIKKWKSQFER